MSDDIARSATPTEMHGPVRYCLHAFVDRTDGTTETIVRSMASDGIGLCFPVGGGAKVTHLVREYVHHPRSWDSAVLGMERDFGIFVEAIQ